MLQRIYLQTCHNQTPSDLLCLIVPIESMRVAVQEHVGEEEDGHGGRPHQQPLGLPEPHGEGELVDLAHWQSSESTLE